MQIRAWSVSQPTGDRYWVAAVWNEAQDCASWGPVNPAGFGETMGLAVSRADRTDGDVDVIVER